MADRARLLGHELHRGLGAEERAQKVDLDHGLDGTIAELREGPTTAVDTGIVDPVVDQPELLLGGRREVVHRLGARHVALHAVDLAVRVLGLERRNGSRRILDVADHHRMPARQELVGVAEAHAVGAAGDHDAEHRRGHAGGGRPTSGGGGPEAAAVGPDRRERRGRRHEEGDDEATHLDGGAGRVPVEVRFKMACCRTVTTHLFNRGFRRACPWS
mmetsp:Transcript_25765/g.68837  ORF Transcript_25765/g.68837 Transcript_25765/m.68837 type:complete len:216 (-) Transcript_25765:31-678(-)